MTYEHEMSAIKALAGTETALYMRQPGDWYLCAPSLEIGGDGLLRGVGGTGGPTPEAAVHDAWRKLTELKPEQYIVRGAMRADRSHHRWNGFMWERLPLPALESAAASVGTSDAT